MKNLFVFLFMSAFLRVSLPLSANARIVTLVVENWPSPASSNEVNVAANEVAELVAYSAFSAGTLSMPFSLYAQKDGKDLELYLSAAELQSSYSVAIAPAKHIIAGPAKIRFWTTQQGPGAKYCTWKISPEELSAG